jgi:hypothetical protein
MRPNRHVAGEELFNKVHDVCNAAPKKGLRDHSPPNHNVPLTIEHRLCMHPSALRVCGSRSSA